jgi:thiamine-phosphate pyrophosphorylase
MTDPARTPDPVRIAARLPPGSAVIHRHFGSLDARDTARRLRQVTRARRILLLIGDDEQLAAEVGADGVHLPERRVSELARLRARRPLWIVSAAAHSARALRRAGLADAVLLSPAFASRSPSAGRPLGPVRFARLARLTRTPLLALGGVNGRTAGRAIGAGAAGLAAVEAWAA